MRPTCLRFIPEANTARLTVPASSGWDALLLGCPPPRMPSSWDAFLSCFWCLVVHFSMLRDVYIVTYPIWHSEIICVFNCGKPSAMIISNIPSPHSLYSLLSEILLNISQYWTFHTPHLNNFSNCFCPYCFCVYLLALCSLWIPSF